jgi:hypothetical protein
MPGTVVGPKETARLKIPGKTQKPKEKNNRAASSCDGVKMHQIDGWSTGFHVKNMPHLHFFRQICAGSP